MKKKSTFVLLFLTFFSISFAQSSLNDYKYVIVPNKFEFLKTADEYRLNWLTKSLFKDLKFEALMSDDALPEELKNNACLALKADVLDDSNFIKTALKIQLKDCDGKIVYTSQEGISKDKNYKKTYHEALRKAFKFLEKENYSYTPNEKVLAKANTSNQVELKEIQKLKEEIKELKAEKEPKGITVAKVEKQPIIKTKPISKDKPKVTPVHDNVLTTELIQGSSVNYLVKNNKGDVVYTLLNCGQKDLYIVRGKDAIVSKVNDNWVISEYVRGYLEVKTIDIKF